MSPSVAGTGSIEGCNTRSKTGVAVAGGCGASRKAAAHRSPSVCMSSPAAHAWDAAIEDAAASRATIQAKRQISNRPILIPPVSGPDFIGTPVETVNVVWTAIDVSSVSAGAGSTPCGRSPAMFGVRIRTTAACRQLTRRSPAVRYEKRIGETKNAHICDQPGARGKPLAQGTRTRPAVVLPGEGEAPLPQHFRRIYAVFLPERLGEPGRTAKAVLSGDPSQRIRPSGAQHLRSCLFQPGLVQHPHRGGAAETLKRDLQRANAAASGLGDLHDAQRQAGIGPHERFGPAHITRSSGRLLPSDPFGVVMRQPEQQTERQVLLEAADRDVVGQQCIGVLELGEQVVEHAADRAAGAACLIEHQLEFDGFDALPVQQSLELPPNERGWQSKKEPVLHVARYHADSRPDAIDKSCRGIAG